MKKSTGSVLFWFYKPETEKTKPNRTQTKKKPEKPQKKPSQNEKTKSNRKNRAKKKPKKPSQTGKNQAKPVFLLKNQIEPKPVGLNRYRFFLIWFGYFFLKKTKPKMITPTFEVDPDINRV